jgi:hypothetical protein
LEINKETKKKSSRRDSKKHSPRRRRNLSETSWLLLEIRVQFPEQQESSRAPQEKG